MGRDQIGSELDGAAADGTVVAVVLAGGAGRRMDGADKAALELDGVTFLDRVLGAAAGVAGRLVVVGPPRPVTLERAVIFVQEADLGGGPVPAVAAALEATGGAGIVLVVAVDLPLLAPADLGRLLSALEADPQWQAAAAADHKGRPNPLLAAYRVDALRAAVAGLEGTGRGVAAARLLPQRVACLDLGPASFNVNTREDLERARSSAGGNHSPMTSLPSAYAEALARAAEVGIRLDDDEVEAVLALARTVAHATERRFAPLTTYLAGKYVLARTGDGVPAAEALAEAVALVKGLLPPPDA